MLLRTLIVVSTAAVLAGGCASREAQVLGSAPAGSPSPIRSVRSVGEGQSLVLAGKMVEKCPVSGCWFDLQDQGGTIRVDTKNAGFVVLDVPLHSQVTVAGRVRRANGEAHLEAEGIRY